MAEFRETVEEIRADEASVRNLFDGDGRRVRDARHGPEYMERLVETSRFVAEIMEGRRPMYHLQEAMTTSDFPLLFADILDRQLLANYRETPATYQAYTRASTVPDFRNVKRFAVDGAESVLPEVNERTEYPEAALEENADMYRVKKYGRRLDLSWEALVNDDLDAFRRNPERLARAARRSEQKFATTLFVDANGPHASLYTNGFKNIVPGNPELSINALQEALTLLSRQTDNDGEPILIEMAVLVVPPALTVPANNLLQAVELQIGDTTDASTPVMRTANWMRNNLRLVVEPYIPHVATDSNGDTSWFLFADPNSGRTALEFGKLRGYEDPALFQKDPDSTRIGGGGQDVVSFADDTTAWKVRHVFGGGQLTNTGGAKSTVASDGSGSGSS